MTGQRARRAEREVGDPFTQASAALIWSSTIAVAPKEGTGDRALLDNIAAFGPKRPHVDFAKAQRVSVACAGVPVEARLVTPTRAAQDVPNLSGALSDGGFDRERGLHTFPAYRIRGLTRLDVSLWRGQLLTGVGALAIRPEGAPPPAADTPGERAAEWRRLLETPGLATIHGPRPLPSAAVIWDHYDRPTVTEAGAVSTQFAGLPRGFNPAFLSQLYATLARREDIALPPDVLDPRNFARIGDRGLRLDDASRARTPRLLRGRSGVLLALSFGAEGPARVVAAQTCPTIDRSGNADFESFGWVRLTGPATAKQLAEAATAAEHLSNHLFLLALLEKRLADLFRMSDALDSEGAGADPGSLRRFWKETLSRLAPLWGWGHHPDLDQEMLAAFDCAFSLQQRWRDAWAMGGHFCNVLG